MSIAHVGRVVSKLSLTAHLTAHLTVAVAQQYPQGFVLFLDNSFVLYK